MSKKKKQKKQPEVSHVDKAFLHLMEIAGHFVSAYGQYQAELAIEAQK